eukprot:251621_1
MGTVSSCNCCGKIDVNTEDEINTELMEIKEQPDMKWIDDLLIQSDSYDRNIDIILSVCKELLGENIMSRIINPKQYQSAMIWSKLCHRCDISYPLASQLQIINDKNLFDEMKYAIRHAIAAYPTSFVTVLGLLPKNKMLHGLQSTSKLLKSCFDIDEKDIIINNVTNNLIADNIINKTRKPNFYLCVDHKRSKIVLSIRGTASIYDGLIDVNAEPIKYTVRDVSGYVHKGILTAAQFVFNKTCKELMRLCSQYTDYTVCITGHSLGAGIASMLGLIYCNKDNVMIFEQLQQNKLKIYSFASPCIVSKHFDTFLHRFINTIILTTDIVTRLSIESIKKLNIRLDLIANCSNEIIRNALMYSRNDKTSETFLKNVKEVKTENEELQLFPLGKILWFTPKIVMDENMEKRRRFLMGVSQDNKIKKQNKKKTENNRNYYNGFGFNKLINIKNTMPIIGAKHKEKYIGSNYVLCDASKCKLDICQELVTDLPESLYSHLPNRYIWACDAEMIEQENS